VIACGPAVKLDVESDALPPFTVDVPSKVVPSKNCTVPVAVDEEIAALNVTGWPGFDGLRLDVSAVVVFALLTVCDNPADVLPL
jgi:hypothetical protein